MGQKRLQNSTLPKNVTRRFLHSVSEHLSSTAKGLFRHRYNGSEISPPVRLLSFPIRIGETWESEHTCGGQKFKVHGRVGCEEVEVPAGKFKAITLHLQE